MNIDLISTVQADVLDSADQSYEDNILQAGPEQTRTAATP